MSNDPLGTRIYTLDNGLKIYMSVNKEKPRIQTYIAVRNGGKNDPSDNTGLAHYLEHIMFKGTEQYGTSDYEAEKPLLDSICTLFDVYKTKTDPEERREIYKEIDSLSYEASKLAIPNEYDKLMALIGSDGSNAFTSTDVTCYQEDIPSNQADNWARIQADRFKNLVVRGFHTELEAVYEELNMGLNDDAEKAYNAIDAMLFKKHPYGLQTVIGTQEHLKNPSISAILRQKSIYYVPNNTAICVSGDFDPDEFVKIIEKHFGDWKANPELPVFSYEQEDPVTSPRIREVFGTEAEFVLTAWRFPGQRSKESDCAEIASSILYNRMAGLIDLDINRSQKALGVNCYTYNRPDYGEMIFSGYPKDGQSLEEVNELILQEVSRLRKGDFDESMVNAAIANYKLHEMKELEQNSGRAMKYVDSFINGNSWKDDAGKIARIEVITKEDIVRWAEQYLGPDSYATVYKRFGEDKSIKKFDAPAITPIVTNRDLQSDFLKEVQACTVKPIEPSFTDYSKEMSVLESNGTTILYKKNTANDIARLEVIFDKGKLNDAAYPTAFAYADYLGTPDMPANEIVARLYSIACNYNTRVTDNTITISLDGLNENIGEALSTVLNLYNKAKADETVLDNLKQDEFKAREDNKHDLRTCSRALSNYLKFGPEYIRRTTLTNEAYSALTSEELLSKVRTLLSTKHKILYYGSYSEAEVKKMITDSYIVDGCCEESSIKTCEDSSTKLYAKPVSTDRSEVYVAHYDSRQFNYSQFSCRNEKFDVMQAPAIYLFNEYFGAGMNTVVFQEMRESRALAYRAYARLMTPKHLQDTYSFIAEIGSQSDKLRQAVEAFDQIINEMPESEKSMEIAKTAIDSRLRTTRASGMKVLKDWLALQELGLDTPLEKTIFEKVKNMSMKDLKATQEKWVKNRTYHYGILGNEKELDSDFLKTLGPVKYLSQEEIFGY